MCACALLVHVTKVSRWVVLSFLRGVLRLLLYSLPFSLASLCVCFRCFSDRRLHFVCQLWVLWICTDSATTVIRMICDSDDNFYNRSDPYGSMDGSDGGDDGECSLCRSPRSPDALAREESVSDHIVLLTSKGRACPVGRDHHGQCTIPVLADSVIYTHVATGGTTLSC